MGGVSTPPPHTRAFPCNPVYTAENIVPPLNLDHEQNFLKVGPLGGGLGGWIPRTHPPYHQGRGGWAVGPSLLRGFRFFRHKLLIFGPQMGPLTPPSLAKGVVSPEVNGLTALVLTEFLSQGHCDEHGLSYCARGRRAYAPT